MFGPARILFHDREKKTWFLDRLLAKHGDASWVFEPGYPLLSKIILYEQKTVMRRLIDSFFEGLGVKPRIAMVMENIEAIKSLVGAGLGASVLPVPAVGKEEADRKVTLMRVDKHPLQRQLGLVTLKSSYIPNAVREMSKMIREELQSPAQRKISKRQKLSTNQLRNPV